MRKYQIHLRLGAPESLSLLQDLSHTLIYLCQRQHLTRSQCHLHRDFLHPLLLCGALWACNSCKRLIAWGQITYMMFQTTVRHDFCCEPKFTLPEYVPGPVPPAAALLLFIRCIYLVYMTRCLLSTSYYQHSYSHSKVITSAHQRS